MTIDVSDAGADRGDDAVPFPMGARLVAWSTLSNLPGPAAAAAIGVLVFACWGVTILLGGAGPVAPHWFYLPVFLAGLRFGKWAALGVGGVVMIVAGPLLPLTLHPTVAQATSDWVSRGIFFIVIGQFVTLLFGAVRQLSERETQAVEVRNSERRFRALVQRASDMITVVDPDGSLKSESPAVERILGWAPGQRLSRSAMEFVHPDDRKRAAVLLDDVLANPGKSNSAELRLADSIGSWHWVEATVTNMVDEPTVRGLVVNSRLVDERKALEEQLIHRTLHDPLTGLANRALLRERLESSLVRRSLSERPLSLLFIDIDDFKVVNDARGHEAGDRILMEISKRLGACAGPDDLVARFGGDEFAILIEDDSPGRDTATEVAQHVLDSLSQPFVGGAGQNIRGASIGIVSYHAGKPDADQILRQADIAMYNAKANGKARYSIFSLEMEDLIRERTDVESELRTALDNDQIRVAYQPIVDLATRDIVAVEALLRWQHPKRGTLLPVDFLDVAEASGLIVPLGRLVLNDACQQIRRWRDHFTQDIRVGVNLSATQLQHPSLIDDMCEAVASAGIDPSALILEVTEGGIFKDLDGATSVLESLRSLGASIAVDDFGTGYSSLAHLHRFPVDIIKVDKSFVDKICGNETDVIPGQAVIVIGRALHLEVVAEGIETEDQDAELIRLGCGYGQGHLYSPAIEAAAIDQLLGAVKI